MQRERRRLVRLAIPPAVLLGADYVIGASRPCTSGGGHVVHARVQKVRGGMTTAAGERRSIRREWSTSRRTRPAPWERTPWHATLRAAWEALKRLETTGGDDE
jgi:hypothetical protein